MAFSKFEEQVFLTTVLIQNLTDGEFGTGFLITKPIDPSDPKKKKILLFSNKHVFWGKADMKNPEAKKKLSLTLHRRETDGSYKPGSVHTFIFETDRKQAGYFDHPEENVDVACANISDVGNKNIPLNIIALDVDNFIDFDKNVLTASTKILFVGYPTGFYDRKHWLPVMRLGSIASIPSINFNGERQILVDAQVFPGSSGSPVFVSVNGRYKLLGIISNGVQKRLDFAEVKKSTNDQEQKNQIPTEWMGLGLLFTNETIKEGYNLA